MSKRVETNKIFPKKFASKNKTPKKFQKNASKVQQIQKAEQEEEFTEFLERKNIKNSVKNREKIKRFLQERQIFNPNFSLEDFSENEIDSLKSDTQKENWQENKSEAHTAESLIDSWKAEGFSNYKVIQKLLQAHKTGIVTLLPEKYQQFSQFFALLENNEFAEDTVQIIEIINQSDTDLATPRAFDKLVFAIFEDERIGTVTKEKLARHFKIFPVRTGNDLKENLYNKQRQISQWKKQSNQITKTLFLLESQSKATKERLLCLKQEIFTEKNLEKRLELEKRYDELETRLQRLEKDSKTQEKQQKTLQSEKNSSEIFIRGASAKLQNGAIVLTIPETDTKVSVPEYFDSADIAKVVNAHLMYNLFQSFGLESYLFYTSDFSGDYPTQSTLNRNNNLLQKLGFSYDGLILKKSELKDLHKIIAHLMLPNFYSSNITLKENAERRLQKLGLLKDKNLNSEKFVEKLLWIQQFGELKEEQLV